MFWMFYQLHTPPQIVCMSKGRKFPKDKKGMFNEMNIDYVGLLYFYPRDKRLFNALISISSYTN